MSWFWRIDRRLQIALELTLRIMVAALVAAWAHSTFINDVGGYWLRAQDIGWHNLPYRNFLWEYPPLAALPLLLIPLTGRNDASFHISFVLVMIAIEYISLQLLRKARPSEHKAITALWTLTIVPLGAIAYYRLDYIPMLCATIALIAMMAKRRSILSVVAGFAAKLWPIIFVAPLLLQRRWRDATYVVVGCVAVVGTWIAFSPHGFHEFVSFRQGTGFQVESIPGSILLLAGRKPQFLFGALVVSDSGWHWLQFVMNALLVLLPVGAFAIAWKRPHVNLVAFTGFLVTVLLLSQRLLSPQFLVWLGPFVAWLWVKQRRQGILFIVATWMTVLTIQLYTSFLHGNDFADALCVARNGVLVWLSVEMARIAFHSDDRTELVTEEPRTPTTSV